MSKVQVEVESSGLQLMQAVAAVVSAVKAGGAEAAVGAALAQIEQVLAAIQSLPADAKESTPELIEGALVGAVQVVQAAIG